MICFVQMPITPCCRFIVAEALVKTEEYRTIMAEFERREGTSGLLSLLARQ